MLTGPFLSKNWMAATEDFNEADIVMVGLPYDGTCCSKPGSRFAPQEIRLASIDIETYSPIQQHYLHDRFLWGELPQSTLNERQEEVRVYNQNRDLFVQELNDNLSTNNKNALVELLLKNNYFREGNIWFLMNEPEIREILIQHPNGDLVDRVMLKFFRLTRKNQRIMFWLWQTISGGNAGYELLNNYKISEIDKDILIDAAAHDSNLLNYFIVYFGTDQDMLFDLADAALDARNSDSLELIFRHHPYLFDMYDWRNWLDVDWVKRERKRRSNWLLKQLTKNFITLRKAMPTLPKELARKIVLRAQYEQLCRDLGENEIPQIQLIKLMNILGLEYNWGSGRKKHLWTRKKVCEMVREALEKRMDPEISRMERDIKETLRLQELEELDRREKKRLKRNLG